MRMLMSICVLLLVGLNTSNLDGSSPRVSMSDKLQGTWVEKMLKARLVDYVGRVSGFVIEHQGVSYLCEGRITEVIVPNITDYVAGSASRDDVGFKARLSDVRVNTTQHGDSGDSRPPNIPLPDIVNLADLNIVKTDAIGRMHIIYSNRLGFEFLDGGRLLGVYKNKDGESFSEYLVEHKDISDWADPISILVELREPFIALVKDPLPVPLPRLPQEGL